MKNIDLPCDCRLSWNENELELIMCDYHFYGYVDVGFTLPAEEFIMNVTSPKGSYYSSKTLVSLR
ncbi:MAG: hypothetical protein WA326_11040 [Nitrososphaeraceae archaeon]